MEKSLRAFSLFLSEIQFKIRTSRQHDFQTQKQSLVKIEWKIWMKLKLPVKFNKALRKTFKKHKFQSQAEKRFPNMKNLKPKKVLNMNRTAWTYYDFYLICQVPLVGMCLLYLHTFSESFSLCFVSVSADTDIS